MHFLTIIHVSRKAQLREHAIQRVSRLVQPINNTARIRFDILEDLEQLALGDALQLEPLQISQYPPLDVVTTAQRYPPPFVMDSEYINLC